MHYGFIDFCEYSTSKYPGYKIVPVRLNGSAIETLFSQLKHVTSGQLSGVNYATARAAVMTHGSVSEKKRQTDSYRNTQLHIRKHPITRTNYKRKRTLTDLSVTCSTNE